MVKAKQLTAGVFILLAAIGATYFVSQGDTAYLCEDTELVGICWKLSNVNAEGTQTRCYYNDSTPTRYKTCKTGWNEYVGNVTGTPIKIPNKIIDILGTDTEILNSKGIFAPSISECVKIDNFTCSSRVYEFEGIDKELIVNYNFCGVFGNIITFNESVFNNQTNLTEIVEMTINGNNGTCMSWTTLSQAEIESELKIKTRELLDGIIKIEKERNIVKQDVFLTNKTEVNLG